MRYLLDTSVCVFFLRGKYDLDNIIKNKGRSNCYISEITLFELRFGAENSENPLKSHKAVDLFVAGLTVVPIFGCAILYAKEKVRLKKAGKPVHDEFDFLIGITSVEHDLVLVTDNVKDFANISGIRIENWIERKPESPKL